MSKQRLDLGRKGEDLAVAYLKNKGLRIIARNYRHKLGEIDIIARDKETYVFIEVKTRQGDRFGHPAEAVTAVKQQQISRTAQEYLARHDLLEAMARFDVIAIITGRPEPEICHLVAAFDAC